MKKSIMILISIMFIFGNLLLIEAEDNANKDFICVFAGRDCTLGISSNGCIRTTGYDATEIEKIFNGKGKYVDFASKVSMIGLTIDGDTLSYPTMWDEDKFNIKGPYIKIADGAFFIAGLKEDGTVYAESNFMNEKERVFPWENIIELCEFNKYSYPHVCGLKEDGTVVMAWVNSSKREYGFKDAPENFKNIIQMDGAFNVLAGLKKDGTVTAYEFTFDSEVVLPWSDIVDIAVRDGMIYALKSDGTVVGYNTDFDIEVNITDWYDIVSISASGSHVVALRKDGKVLAAGNNEYGQCNVESWDLTPLSGDANDDNEVNAKDALAILKVAAQIDDFGTEFLPGQWSPENAKLTNGSLESVNAKDALAVLKIAAKIQ